MQTVSKHDPECLSAWPSPGYTEREQAALDALVQQRDALAAKLLCATDDATKQELEAKVRKLDQEL